MSHHTLQSLVVRMLFDGAFVEAVHADPARALAGVALTEAERAQLLGVDRRAWRHDALRSRRTLHTLVEEFKISTTIVLSETRSLASLERFFSTPFFHRAVQERGSLGMAFSEFLLNGSKRGEWKAPQIEEVVRLEAAIAQCRRALAREGPSDPTPLPATIHDRTRVRLGPGYDAGSFQANLIPTIQAVEKYLFEMSLMPAMALCDDAPRLPALPPVDRSAKTFLLFGPGATGISLSHLDKAAWLVLLQARLPIEIRNLLARARTAGVAAKRAPEILSEWMEHGAVQVVE
ncbi:MAG: hypothetical protein SF339_13790 [Blastocatellia bacterium]|nr:hypothetical protein [Blastocatellia bacterium]